MLEPSGYNMSYYYYFLQPDGANLPFLIDRVSILPGNTAIM